MFSCIFRKVHIRLYISFFFTYISLHIRTLVYIFAFYIETNRKEKKKQSKKTKTVCSCRNMSRNQHRLVPGPSPSDDHDHDTENGSPPGDEVKGSGTWKKRVSTACLACKKSKRKVRFHYIHYVTLHLYLHLHLYLRLHLHPHLYPHTKTNNPVLGHIPLCKLPNLQKSLHLRRIPRPTSPRRRKKNSRRTLLPPRPPLRPLQARPRSK